ncbi:MAG: DNA cytosine methyltransferase, partial [Patescibacteria group bacterium]|nr:DNA cytosine methyltransferase [Patescibacteria group bacterium]
MRLLDLFCGAGGAAMGYQRAGFEITGVDHEPQPNYPFEFIRADALRYLELLLETERWGVINPEAANACGYLLSAFDASPPCQKFSRMNRAVRAKHPDLVAPVRR